MVPFAAGQFAELGSLTGAARAGKANKESAMLETSVKDILNEGLRVSGKKKDCCDRQKPGYCPGWSSTYK